MQKLYATLRIEKKTGKPAIFYTVPFSRSIPLTVFTREEGHSGACFEYYYKETKPCKDTSLPIVAYYTELCARIDNQQLVIQARLRGNQS